MKLLIVLLVSTVLWSQVAPPVFPSKDWERAKPESAGMSSPRLEVLRSWLKTQNTTSMMIISRGKSVFEYGDLAKTTKVASVRKSILAMMFGKYAASGKVDLNKTVKEIGLDDVQPFLPVEESATLLNLLTARSAIYHDSGNKSLTDLSPRRGSMYPGLYFQYQNWDFNAAGTAFEKLTGQDLFAALESDLAGPLGMQDFDRKKQRKNSSMPDSVHPEYAMYLSTRDMARLGLLMSRDGMWNGKRILPEGWASRITTLVTPADQIRPLGAGGAGLVTMDRWGYGMLWWVWDVPKGVEIGPFHGVYTAMGANGQYITVFPEDDVVVVHKVDIDTDESNEVKPIEYTATLALVVAAECSEECK